MLQVCIHTYRARWIKSYSGKVKFLTASIFAFPSLGEALDALEKLRSKLLNTCL